MHRSVQVGSIKARFTHRALYLLETGNDVKTVKDLVNLVDTSRGRQLALAIGAHAHRIHEGDTASTVDHEEAARCLDELSMEEAIAALLRAIDVGVLRNPAANSEGPGEGKAPPPGENASAPRSE